MKKLIAALAVAATLLFASPTFAYTVKSGDTMSKIARDNSLNLADLARLNPQIQNLDLIHVGEIVDTQKSEETTMKPEIIVGYSTYEIDLLARLVRAEAQTEPYQGKVAVACVVLNRVDSSAFPNSIKEVIYQKRQFQPVQNGQINKPADEDSINAVHEALNGSRSVAGGSLYFYNPAIATSRWLDSRATTLVIGRHVFKI
ncbi:sporulation specific N-acetylmuramoyl-L-alanine amidase [Neobacillus bataviensis LMG 21833]|uniref:Sporulation specific N-acetylmuramoyl-L-alanine amidase n=1 Tax=Neobacillus bataviensis LMG 21833 TaxID=1117379 RepID=K6D3A8_9BACI|nr:cell wall hydrolase [Neobacillus bataviensis]EKN62749.1 sporulation specific N-acetylmuramoyl-L-alanine amidase [Neobacillus bataviensis LMG 21833]